MSPYRFLACFAHPDDETFSCGGLFADYRRRGIQSTLVCATRGEAGEISDPSLGDQATLGQIRTQELLEAARHVGVDEVIFLGFRDSGMAGSPDNDLPTAYARASGSAVTYRLVRILRRLRPQVVVTFDPTGGYGHPDHIAIHRHTLAAFHAAADATFAPQLGEPWRAQRLFYPALNRDIFRALREQLIAQGEEPPAWDSEDGFQWPDQPVHARVDVSHVASVKWAALLSHRTQIGARHPFRLVPESFMQHLLSYELFELAWPEQKPAQPWPDLFHGL